MGTWSILSRPFHYRSCSISTKWPAHSRNCAFPVPLNTTLKQGSSPFRSRLDLLKANNELIICFVTGVPGSGKTLVGLNLAYLRQSDQSAIHFMSGNGPLVNVLQTAFVRHQMGKGERSLEARIQAKTLIENVHRFASTYDEQTPPQAPSNHVIIFDEAQRAWDRAQNERKFKRPYSEPDMLLRIMERHEKWAAIIALVGGGQEINSGEAGLAEWGLALANTARHWKIYASPEVITGGASVAGNRLLSSTTASFDIVEENQLHLKVSVRNLRAERFAQWVNDVIEGIGSCAASLRTWMISSIPNALFRNSQTIPSSAAGWLQPKWPCRFIRCCPTSCRWLRA